MTLGQFYQATGLKEYGEYFTLKTISAQQQEWNQKLWWIHLETIVCILKVYQYTGNEKCLAWFENVHDIHGNILRIKSMESGLGI